MTSSLPRGKNQWHLKVLVLDSWEKKQCLLQDKITGACMALKQNTDIFTHHKGQANLINCNCFSSQPSFINLLPQLLLLLLSIIFVHILMQTWKAGFS